MEGSRFDRLARSLAGTGSRRGFLSGLLGLGAGLAGGASTEAACPPGQVSRRGTCLCKRTGRPPVNGACPCPRGQTDAGDGQDCLECRSVDECPLSESCIDGECVCTGGACACPKGATACDGLHDQAPSYGGDCNCAERADGAGNTCWNGMSVCSGGGPICQTDADCEPYCQSDANCDSAYHCVKLGSCARAGACNNVPNNTACVRACG